MTPLGDRDVDVLRSLIKRLHVPGRAGADGSLSPGIYTASMAWIRATCRAAVTPNLREC